MDENYAKTTIKASDYSRWHHKIGAIEMVFVAIAVNLAEIKYFQK
jgi:hypothetical protein